jgi:hypothetical protein
MVANRPLGLVRRQNTSSGYQRNVEVTSEFVSKPERVLVRDSFSRVGSWYRRESRTEIYGVEPSVFDHSRDCGKVILGPKGNTQQDGHMLMAESQAGADF